MQGAANLSRRETQHDNISVWYVAALVVSLGLHAGFYSWSKATAIEGFSQSQAPALLPPRFVLKQVNIDPRAAQDVPEPPAPARKEPLAPEKLVFSDAKPQAADVKLEVKPVDIPAQLAEEKPKPPANTIAMAKLDQSTVGALDGELSSLAGTFLKTGPVSSAQPVLAISAQLAKGTSQIGTAITKADASVSFAGRQSLEDVLNGIGKVPTKESPVAIPGNALFSYDSVELGPESLPILEKIADLRLRFPDYIMVIVGHTDNIGSPDYNLRLSQRRADAVKEWLVRRYNVNPARLDTIGRGAQELLIPSGTVDEQASNRRVEVLLVPAKAGKK